MTTEENPANHTTHPVPEQISSLTMWWGGPQWLSDGNLNRLKQSEIVQSTEVKKEIKWSEISLDLGTFPKPHGEENKPLNDQNTAVESPNRPITPY